MKYIVKKSKVMNTYVHRLYTKPWSLVPSYIYLIATIYNINVAENDWKWQKERSYFLFNLLNITNRPKHEGFCGLDRMVVWFTTTYAINAYHY